MEYTFRKASAADIPRIMEIIGETNSQMAREGKNQWTEAYPSRADIEVDVRNGSARVMLAASGRIVAYGAIVLTGEQTKGHGSGNQRQGDRRRVHHGDGRSRAEEGVGAREHHQRRTVPRGHREQDGAQGGEQGEP